MLSVSTNAMRECNMDLNLVINGSFTHLSLPNDPKVSHVFGTGDRKSQEHEQIKKIKPQ